MLQRLAATLLLAPLIQGCAGLSTQLPGTTKLLDDLPRVENSTKSPCWQQRQVAAQNSYLATIKEARATVYKAPCDLAPKVASK